MLHDWLIFAQNSIARVWHTWLAIAMKLDYSRPRSKDFFFASCGSLFPFTRANAQWLFMGLSSTIIYTSELPVILCSTICVPSATRHNIHIIFLYELKFYIFVNYITHAVQVT